MRRRGLGGFCRVYRRGLGDCATVSTSILDISLQPADAKIATSLISGPLHRPPPCPCLASSKPPVVSLLLALTVRGFDATMSALTLALTGRLLFSRHCIVRSARRKPRRRRRADFFETKIRPVLANNCYSCHTSSQLGGLRLDSRDAMLKGGKSGPALVPGDPEQESADHGRPTDRPAEDADGHANSRPTRWKTSSRG